MRIFDFPSFKVLVASFDNLFIAFSNSGPKCSPSLEHARSSQIFPLQKYDYMTLVHTFWLRSCSCISNLIYTHSYCSEQKNLTPFKRRATTLQLMEEGLLFSPV